MDVFLLSWKEGELGVQRRKAFARGSKGAGPLASLAESEKPKGFFEEAVRCGLPQCETCLAAPSRFRSLGGRRGSWWSLRPSYKAFPFEEGYACRALEEKVECVAEKVTLGYKVTLRSSRIWPLK